MTYADDLVICCRRGSADEALSKFRGPFLSDSDDDRLLGHEDSRTLNRRYKRKAVKVTPLRPKILDTR